MNSVSNSDSEQCIESRLGQVHNVHTPMAQPARTLARVASLVRSCRKPGPVVSQAPPAMSLHPRARWRAMSQAMCCAPCRRPCVARHVAHRIVAQGAVSWRFLRRIAACIAAPIATQMPPQATIQFLYRDTHPQRPGPRARAPLALRAGRLYRRPPGRVVAMLLPSRGALLAISWP